MAASGDSTGPPESEETELVGGRGKQQSNMAAAASGEGSTASLLQPDAPSINIPLPPLPPLPLRCPPYPESDNWKALRDWNMGCWRISKLAAKDPRRHLPTVIKPKDRYLKKKNQAQGLAHCR